MTVCELIQELEMADGDMPVQMSVDNSHDDVGSVLIENDYVLILQ